MADPKFTADELLSWFCVTKPVKMREDREAPTLPCPPSARYAAEKREQALVSDSMEPEKGLSVRGGMKYPQNLHQLPSLQPPLSAYGSSKEDETFAGNPTNSCAIPGDDDYQYPTTTTVFDNYSFDQDDNPVLPIAAYRGEILDTVESNSVTVIQGSTGSGKSTQVPQFLLSQYASQRRYCNIICTQPRRIAAMSVAKFVAESRGWRLGTLVGYQIAMDKVVSEDTRLSFVTTGVLLQKLVNMKNMNQFTHIILDEVHLVQLSFEQVWMSLSYRYTRETRTQISVYWSSENFFGAIQDMSRSGWFANQCGRSARSCCCCCRSS